MSAASRAGGPRTGIAAVLDLARDQDGVLHRRQIYGAAVTRAQVRAQLASQRWARLGNQTVALHRGPLSERACWWRAVLETGPTAALDGVSALRAAGVTRLSSDLVDVAAPKSSRPRRAVGVTVHETRRLRRDDIITVGLPRVRPAVAAVHAALWASSDRQAALMLVVPVQQRIVRPADLVVAMQQVKRHRRRALLIAVIGDVCAGAQSLGELDLGALCRRRGLPEPSRQVVRLLPGGRVYLDAVWDPWGVVAEVDGIGHTAAEVQIEEC